MTGASVLLLYIAAYATNSIFGGYVSTQTGNVRITISLDDSFFWMPRYGWAQRYTWPDGRRTIRVEGVGYLFLPLILLDQAYWHPTIIYLGEDNNVTRLKDRLRRDTLHPVHHRDEIAAWTNENVQPSARPYGSPAAGSPSGQP